MVILCKSVPSVRMFAIVRAELYLQYQLWWLDSLDDPMNHAGPAFYADCQTQHRSRVMKVAGSRKSRFGILFVIARNEGSMRLWGRHDHLHRVDWRRQMSRLAMLDLIVHHDRTWKLSLAGSLQPGKAGTAHAYQEMMFSTLKHAK